jgi:hypothetical protein
MKSSPENFEEKRKKKESALSLLLILSLLVYTRVTFFSPAVFKKRKMERRGSTHRDLTTRCF